MMTLDHQPPIALHVHRGFGAGCCHLAPACANCNTLQGRVVARRVRAMKKRPRASQRAASPRVGWFQHVW
jgi:hypothetical protein